MTDEEKAEEWIKNHSGLIGSYEYVKYDYDSMKQGFLAGLKVGRSEWNFVKDGELPKDNKLVLVYREDEEPQLDYYLNAEGYWKSEKWDREYYARKGDNPPISSIVAWKEIVPPEIIK